MADNDAPSPAASAPDGTVHFFVSYTGADRAWAEWIAWVLEEEHYTTVVQAWDFRPGSDFVADMRAAASKAERTIAVLSPAYLDSAFANAEWNAAFAADPTGAAHGLVPVRVAEVDRRGLDRIRVYIDLVGLDHDGARQALVEG